MSSAEPPVRRALLVSLHTSPLLSPGTGDAGGMNVYVLQTALGLARRGVRVDVATRATGPEEIGVVRPAPGVEVHHLQAGPVTPVAKEDLPQHVAEFAQALAPLVDRVVAEGGVVHSHYWLSGVAALAALGAIGRGPARPATTATGRTAVTDATGRTAVTPSPPPLVHTMHTAARVKNERLAEGERPEPPARVRGEDDLVRRADLLVVNTAEEQADLVRLTDADPGRVRVVAPGVDLRTFHPGPQAEARATLGLPGDALVVLFVGRIQPLKAPDVLVRAVGELLRRDPALRKRLIVPVLGGLSGSGLTEPEALTRLVREEDLDGVVRFGPPLPRQGLARWYRAADLLAMPSHHESFGLVALEALASGTPVLAARVGGLPHAVGKAGTLVDGHDPGDWADALHRALTEGPAPGFADRAREHAEGFSWERTVEELLAAYAHATAHPRRTR